ncbi:hypothetical protein P691DRAFT_791850 [Macrolepiota fuliginosa MF-IS2]|uniref:Uncharacterized protein n=1 Tax=Macrolepiota fuliginosa MF-IS2 TaxID=1400762 RepID=A0A9P6BV41_9AGAR|nr:hypothetical protein P691DRAFT_791850 [Macrolepiota fuliginosa MF-IS2]
MGNSPSTIQIYDHEISSSMQQKIMDSARNQLGSTLSLEQVSHNIAAVADGGTDFEAIRIRSNDVINVVMMLIVAAMFPWKFGYWFSPNPPDCKPPGALSTSKPIGDFCSISTPVTGQIPQYLKDGVFSKLGLPMWVKSQATADLVEATTKLVSERKEPHWDSMKMTQTYNSGVGDQGDWQLDALILHIGGALTMDGLRAGLSMIYFMGSDSKSIQDSSWHDAFSSAAHLPAGGSTPSNDAQLTETLKRNAMTSFQNKFGFLYTLVLPDSWHAQGVASAYLRSNTQLMYLPIQNPGQDYVRTVIEQGLFGRLGLPVASIQRSSQSSWVTNTIDHLYHSADPSCNPIRQKSIVMSWQQYKTNSNGLKIPVIYIFVQAVLYEELPADQRAMQQLMQVLCDKICMELQKLPRNNDLLSLRALLMEYAGIKFRSSFGFSYSGQNSNPPDQSPGGAVKGLDGVLQAKTYPSGMQEVEKWLNQELLESYRKDSMTFPAFANISHQHLDPIWEKIRNDVIGFTKISTSSDWYTAYNSTAYRHPSRGTNIKQYSQYVYTVGELVVDGVKVTQVFICYIGDTEEKLNHSMARWRDRNWIHPCTTIICKIVNEEVCTTATISGTNPIRLDAPCEILKEQIYWQTRSRIGQDVLHETRSIRVVWSCQLGYNEQGARKGDSLGFKDE